MPVHAVNLLIRNPSRLVGSHSTVKEFAIHKLNGLEVSWGCRSCASDFPEWSMVGWAGIQGSECVIRFGGVMYMIIRSKHVQHIEALFSVLRECNNHPNDVSLSNDAGDHNSKTYVRVWSSRDLKSSCFA